jgi:Glyoxalase-like domain
MAVRIDVTIDCVKPELLARFWRAMLGYVDRPVPDGYPSWEDYDRAHGVPEEQLDAGSAALDPDGRGPRLFFQRVPERKQVKNRVHLDVHVSADLDGSTARSKIQTEARRAETLGAKLLRINDDDEDYFVVMRDPEGNEFCLT